MKIDESIEWVKDRMTYGRYTPSIRNPLIIDECYEAGMMAIEALEKQIPKKPFRIIINGELDDELCPTCNSLHIADNYHGVRYNHCPDCGQKLDWSD